MKLRHRDDVKPHPLESIVLKAFQDGDRLDATKLFPYLAGCSAFGGKGAASGNKAYLIVAKDVLGFMEAQGKLGRDREGWYLLAGLHQ